MTKHIYRSACMLGILLTTFLLGCGGDEAIEDGGLTGTVSIDGSSTVFPISEAVAEEFMREHRGVRVNVGVSGTGGGFSKFLRGETDINDASRPIRASELETASSNDIGFIELPVAYDGLAVMVNPENDWVECLTVEELHRIWVPGSEIDNWSEVREGFPDEPLTLFGPGTDSGTYDYFTEAVMGEEGASRTDFSASEDDNVLAQGIAGERGALGFFGLAYYEENADKLKLLGIDDNDGTNGDGCVQPTLETVRRGTYQPLSRPLLVYVRSASTEDPTVAAFVEYYLQNASALAGEVGYVPLTEREYELALERFQAGTTGTMFGEGAQVGVSLEELLGVESLEADTAAVRP